jgi:hypothetical protein
MRSFNLPIRLFTVFLALTLCACSASQPKPPPQPSSLRVVTLNTNITMAESPEFEPSGGAITAGLNAMGAKLGNARLEELKEMIKRGGIDLRQLVLDSVRSELGKSDSPIKIVEENGEADVRLNIEAYGMHKGLEWIVVPSIDLRASLVRADNATIWENHEYVDQRHQFSSGVKTNTYSEYQQNPVQLKADFTTNIAWVVHKLIEDLKEDHANGEIGAE